MNNEEAFTAKPKPADAKTDITTDADVCVQQPTQNNPQPPRPKLPTQLLSRGAAWYEVNNLIACCKSHGTATQVAESRESYNRLRLEVFFHVFHDRLQGSFQNEDECSQAIQRLYNDSGIKKLMGSVIEIMQEGCKQ